jgi:hypothetical protein
MRVFQAQRHKLSRAVAQGLDGFTVEREGCKLNLMSLGLLVRDLLLQ